MAGNHYVLESKTRGSLGLGMTKRNRNGAIGHGISKPDAFVGPDAPRKAVLLIVLGIHAGRI